MLLSINNMYYLEKFNVTHIKRSSYANQNLGFSIFSCIIFLLGCQLTDNSNRKNEINTNVTFKDVSEQIGLLSQPAWKYGGPSVSDINNDGYYDFLLTNHNATPVQLFLSKADGTYEKQPDIFPKVDLHGISSGDYDLDGDNDILLSVGGGNGLKPSPQRLLRNDDGEFVDVTVEAGISEMGARGRSVRWVDLDNDGDLDFLQQNAEKVINEEVPRNIIFSNDGDGTFTYIPTPEFEEIDSERVLITDFNNDNIPDIFAFNSYAKSVLLKGNGDFTFTNVTDEMFPADSDNYHGVISVAQADIDNDGDLDYYLARGKLYFTMAENSISYNKEKGRLDIRDQGLKSHDGITLLADKDIGLSNFTHWPIGDLMEFMPVYVGKNKTALKTPDSEVKITQEQGAGFPEEITDTGWYIGYLGEGKWRLEWMLTDKLAWDIRSSISGLNGYVADWTPQNRGIPDVLLRNDNGKFVNLSNKLPSEAAGNNWGVTPGDFDNDGHTDFFVYRFGELRERVADALFLNDGKGNFKTVLKHGATTEIGLDSHGDMGTAFDYNLDGKIDVLSGDDDNGKWHMYRNETAMLNNHYLLTRIGYSVNGIDSLGAKVTVETDSGKQIKLIGSTSASHSQSVLNIAHFGLGEHTVINKINVRWRDGSELNVTNLKADQLTVIGEFK
jgi:hypothetical protein